MNGPFRAHFVSSSLRLSVSFRPAFTVIELLIVVGVIVLVLALAMPAFNILTGSKSTEMALNQVSSFLGVARNDAISTQQTAGVLFYIDPISQQITMTRVEETAAPTTGGMNVDVYLDLMTDSANVPLESLKLPKGVAIQFVDDAGGGANPLNDRYIGFNTAAYPAGQAFTAAYGGVILFDGRGMLASRTYAFKTNRDGNFTQLGTILYQPGATAWAATYADRAPTNPAGTLALKSQLGFVLFELEPFTNQWNHTDAQITGGSYAAGSPERNEEDWLDTNGLPVLINRYNGTLVKGE